MEKFILKELNKAGRLWRQDAPDENQKLYWFKDGAAAMPARHTLIHGETGQQSFVE